MSHFMPYFVIAIHRKFAFMISFSCILKWEVYMKYEFRLKTGFFETKLCSMSVKNKSITFFCDDSYKYNKISIAEDIILNISVTIKQNHPVEIEIHTLNTIYTGYCINEADTEDIVKMLINEFDSKVSIGN